MAGGPGANVTGMVIVVFSSVEIRDSVRRSARELAGDRDAGVRLEIPYYLKPSLKALESVSYSLKKKFPDVRRNIRFDDENMNLALDFNTDPEGSGNWRRLTPDQATKLRKKMGPGQGQTAAITSDEVLTMLGEDGSSAS